MASDAPSFDEFTKPYFERVLISAGVLYDFGDRQPIVFAQKIQDGYCKLRQFGVRILVRLLAIQPPGQIFFLLLETPQEETNPRVPIRRFRSDRRLCSPQCPVVKVLILFDHAFQIIVLHVSKAAAQEH